MSDTPRPTPAAPDRLPPDRLPPDRLPPDLAPVTGNRLVDAALVEFGTLADHAPADHHDRLAMVQDVLTSVLESSRESVQTPIPGLRQQ